MLYVGLISGTSMDAIDSALVDITDKATRLVGYQQYPIEEKIRTELKLLSGDSSIERISRMDTRLGLQFAQAALKVIRDNGHRPENITAIGCHGQTVLHRPEITDPSSLQIGDPNIIAWQTGITTVSDFRRMDMAAGGQGAPLVPPFHARLFRHERIFRAIINIGGMANVTFLPPRQKDLPVTGFDTGPGNVLLDDWTQQHLGQSMDRGGKWATTGNVCTELLEYLLDDGYFKLPPPKSTGRDYFNLNWTSEKLTAFNTILPPNDVQATLIELTSRSIAASIIEQSPIIQEVFVCGGGVHNPRLMQSIKKQLPHQIINSTEIEGINPDAVEAMTFAWLASCRVQNISGNLPSVTGAESACILGAIYQVDKQ